MAYAYCDISSFYNVFANLVSGLTQLNWIPSNIQNTYKSANKISISIENGQVVQNDPEVTSPRVMEIADFSNLENGWSFLSLGRLLNRISGFVSSNFLSNAQCIFWGWYEMNGRTKKDFGKCTGDLFMVVFDVTIG